MANKTPVSDAKTYRDIGAFWDSQDATEAGGQDEVAVTVAIESQRRYVAVAAALSERVRRAAARRGLSEEALIHRWLEERLQQDSDAVREP